MENTAIRSERSVGLPAASLLKQVALVMGGSAVIALWARLMLPLPYTPVPLTLANFGVLLVGLTLGSRRGFAAAALYLGWGAIGLPVFAMAGAGGVAQLMGATAGYLWAYPVVAFVAGWISERGVRSFGRNLLAATVAEVVLFVGGLSWLAILTHSWHQAAFFGLYPFFFAEVMKVMAASASGLRLRRVL